MPEVHIEKMGVFKLKNKRGRNAVRVEFKDGLHRKVQDLKAVNIIKHPTRNNVIEIQTEWSRANEKSDISIGGKDEVDKDK